MLERLRGMISRIRTGAPASRTDESDPGRGGADGSDPGTGGATEPGIEGSGPAPTTDRGEVLRLLVRNDGRVRKSELIGEMGLEESETLRVLSEMEDDGDVRLVPYGKDVLVCRPGYEPPGQRKL